MTKQEILDRLKVLVPLLDDYYYMSDDIRHYRKQKPLHLEVAELQYELEKLAEENKH